MQAQRPTSALRARAIRPMPNALKAGPPAHRKTAAFKNAFKSMPSWLGRAAAAAEASTVPTAATDTLEAAGLPEPAAEAQQFDYARQWYPLGILEDLDPKVPKAVALLGKDLVLWRDGQNTWRCFEDMCPHRMALLSEGRIEPSDNTLQCAYHGWKFDGSGSCVEIPQLQEAASISKAISNPRACARSYPTKEIFFNFFQCFSPPPQEMQGLVWVWGSSGPNAEAEAAATPPVLLPQLVPTQGEASGDWKFTFQWFTRDLPYSYDILLENVSDPAHVPHAHHGVQGNRAKPTRISGSVHQPMTKEGFAINLGRPGQDKVFSTLSFNPPSLLNYQFHGISTTLSVYAIPTKPGYSRLVAGGVSSGKAPPFVRILRSFPKWVDHILQRNEVLDGDGIFLRRGEENLRLGDNKWKKKFYMPAGTDMPVSWMRSWLDAYAGGTGPCASTGPIDLPRLSRREALDRWEQHTVHCPSCKSAHTAFERLQAVAVAVAAACLVAAAASAKAATGLAALLQPQTAVWFAGAAAALLLRTFFQSVARRFVFTDYVHATR